MPERITVLGIGSSVAPAPPGGGYSLAVGAARHLERAAAVTGEARRIVLGAGASRLDDALEAIAAEPGSVCVLASGDPGFFGIVRALATRFGPEQLDVHPAPSSVSLAFARAGLAWDDALVVSAHGRDLDDAATLAAAGAAKVAVLCSPDAPPEAVAKTLAARGARFDHALVASRLGEDTEVVTRGSPVAIAGGTFDPLSVLVLWRGDGTTSEPSRAWARPAEQFVHRAGLITKAEVRAVVLSKLQARAGQVLWDVGAGSGSVGIDAAVLTPGLGLYAIERDPAAASDIRANAAAAGVAVTVVTGTAPDAFADLPAPDRAFVGGGGIAVLDATIARLAPAGRVVAAYAALDRAAAAYERLGHLVQVSVAHAAPLAGGVRLVARDPVFVCWSEP